MAWKWLLKISGRHHQLLYDYKRNSKAKWESSLVGTHELLQLFCIGARHLCHFGASLVELERRHTLDAAGSSGLFVLIHIHLHEHDLSLVFSIHCCKDRRDALARPAPGRGEVHNHELVGAESVVECGLVRERSDAAH